jgi:glutamate carboxypeptidase
MDPEIVRGWIAEAAEAIAERAVRDVAALVGVSSPSGDVEGAEEAVAVACSLLPPAAEAIRVPCSSTGYAPDLVGRLSGTGSGRLLLLGHLDTVIPHEQHRRLEVEAASDLLRGSGSVDMKGGNVIALGLLRELADRREWYEEVSVLLVNDEEFRNEPFAHGDRFRDYDACFCFEAGELTKAGDDAVVVQRKAALGIAVSASGLAAHSGASPEQGRSALLALARLAGEMAALDDPDGSQHLTVAPTVMRSGETLNVIPATGELQIDMRADSEEAFERVLAAVPPKIDGVSLESRDLRHWPGMDATEASAPLLDAAADLLGRPLVQAGRGGASDASFFATRLPVAIDGLGPLGGAAHAADEHILASSLLPRSQVAAALVAAQLART